MDVEVEANRVERMQCLDNLPTLVTAEQNQQITAPITMEELQEAVSALLHNKASGPDCIPSKFY